MTMPGDTARSGRFGTSGVEASAAPAPAMTLPEAAEAPSRSTDVLALLAPLLQSGGALAQAAPAAAPQQPMRAMMAAAETAPARFDADRFYALLRR